VTFLIALFLAPLTLLTACFAIELIAGVRPLRQQARKAATAAKVVIIVPAHNEEAILADRLSALAAATRGGARILVIADNCEDSTAEVAKSLGVEVAERFEAERRGKGFALDFARLRLRGAPPDIVVVIDADCTVEPSSIDRLVAACAATGRPCQAAYLQAPVADGSPTLQLSTFAVFIKNLVRQRGLQRLAGRVHLLGTGMALPWALFERTELATGNIVEDLQMGLELADAGHPPLLVEEAAVWTEAATEANTFDQRSRWEGGYLQSAAKWAPRMLAHSLRHGDVRGLWAAVSLLIPPLALLILLDVAALIAALFVQWLTGAHPWPAALLSGALILSGAALFSAWLFGGSRFVTLGGLARIPLYLLWKLPLYLGLARRGAPKEWLRTGRS
jgi:cellulose synthase/poly-beta-1,6-N-acetylglucosamine synthase-like glycosyltransferase